MILDTDGLVIKVSGTGESDRIVTLLTKEYGVLRAFVRGAKKVKSRSLSATQLFSYSSFSIYRGRDAYIVDDARPIEVFFSLRDDIERLALAQYFCELAAELAPQESEADAYLRVMLNSLHFLAGGKRPQTFLKAVTELRMLCFAGYMPDLVACAGCAVYADDGMRFDIEGGRLFCPRCRGAGERVTPGVLTAMRHICYSEDGRVYSFTLPDEGLHALAGVVERYLTAHIQKRFRTLDFYKAL
ncbi:MAG: DNA repair protein RecO [Oscillospiraceae bacterium]|nr:DNA repair protein RecO [Oscillospiraceae bacterium]